MHKKHVKDLITVLLFGVMILAALACQSDDEKKLNQDDSFEGPIPGCENNHLPVPLGIGLVVNGVETDMPATVLTTDEVEIAIEYVDEDCNLEGGSFGIIADPDDPNFHELIDYIQYVYDIESIGCSSEEEGHPYYQPIDPLDYLLPEGLERTLPMNWRLWDQCNGTRIMSNLDFTVVEE